MQNWDVAECRRNPGSGAATTFCRSFPSYPAGSSRSWMFRNGSLGPAADGLRAGGGELCRATREAGPRHGLRLSIEPYVAPCNNLEYAGRADEPMCEFFG